MGVGRLNHGRALAWPCSVPPPRVWLASAPARAPAAKQGVEHQYLARVVRLIHHAEESGARPATHCAAGLTETKTAGSSCAQKRTSLLSASSLMRKASFAASIGAPLVTASSRISACVRPLPAPKSGPGLAPCCASRLERAGCPVRACQKGLEPPGFGPKAGPSTANVRCDDPAYRNAAAR